MSLRPRAQAQCYRERHRKQEDDKNLHHTTLFSKEQRNDRCHEQHNSQNCDNQARKYVDPLLGVESYKLVSSTTAITLGNEKTLDMLDKFLNVDKDTYPSDGATKLRQHGLNASIKPASLLRINNGDEIAILIERRSLILFQRRRVINPIPHAIVISLRRSL